MKLEIPTDKECRATLGPVFYWAFAVVGVALGLAIGVTVAIGPDVIWFAVYLATAR